MTTKDPSTIDSAKPATAGVLPFKADSYLEYVEDFDLTEEQKELFLRTLWDIMSTFVRLGFGVESVLPALLQKASENPADAVEQTLPTHEFNVAADNGVREKEEES